MFSSMPTEGMIIFPGDWGSCKTKSGISREFGGTGKGGLKKSLSLGRWGYFLDLCNGIPISQFCVFLNSYFTYVLIL